MFATKVFTHKYMGTPCLAIWKVDKDGNKLGRYPLVTLTAEKAEAVTSNIDQIRVWLEEQILGGLKSESEHEAIKPSSSIVRFR